jgi:hypothetical protein
VDSFPLVEQDCTGSWATIRGMNRSRRNATLIFVKAPLDAVSDVLAERAIEVQRDVLGSEIEISGYFEFAFQLVGHPWSIVIPDNVIEPYRTAAASDPFQLSEVIRQPLISLSGSGTSDVISYALFEDGKIAEYFDGEVGEHPEEKSPYGLKTQRYVVSPYVGRSEHSQWIEDDFKNPTFLESLDYWASHPEFLDEPFPGVENLKQRLLHEHDNYAETVNFWSSRRQFVESPFPDIWNFTRQFLIDNDVFDPAIDAEYLLGGSWLKRGNRYRVVNPGFISKTFDPSGKSQEIISVPDLVRIDYFRFGH